MKIETNKSRNYSVPAIVAVMVGLVCVFSSAQAQNESVEIRELRAALEVAQKQVLEASARAQNSEKQRKELVKSLAEAVRVSEEHVAVARDVQLKLQAFGVDLFTMEENSLQGRLLKAVRDLDISHQEKEAQARALEALGESFTKYLAATKKVAADGAIVEAGEAIKMSLQAVALANDTGKNRSNGKTALDKSKVVSIDSEIGLLVLDMGRSEGIKVGTPVAVLRGDQPIYTAMIVDVRDSICGAVLQDKVAENSGVKVGDSVRLLPNGTN